MILSELSIPYETTYLDFPSIKREPYTHLNPNGRVPAIHDANTGITLWESGAIVDYLIATYDTQHHKLSFPAGSPEDWHCKQWLAFQISGQGPYYGQGVYFSVYEDVPVARERFLKEIERTIGVLDSWLKGEEGGVAREFLVGGRVTYADVAFVPWAALVEMVFGLKGDEGKERFELLRERFPDYWAWIERVMARDEVKKVWEERARVYGQGK